MSEKQKLTHLMGCSLEIQSVTSVPGIGSTYAAYLENHSYTQACQLYMLLLYCNGDKEKFVTKLQELTQGSRENMILAYNALMDWYEKNGSIPT